MPYKCHSSMWVSLWILTWWNEYPTCHGIFRNVFSSWFERY